MSTPVGVRNPSGERAQSSGNPHSVYAQLIFHRGTSTLTNLIERGLLGMNISVVLSTCVTVVLFMRANCHFGAVFCNQLHADPFEHVPFPMPLCALLNDTCSGSIRNLSGITMTLVWVSHHYCCLITQGSPPSQKDYVWVTTSFVHAVFAQCFTCRPKHSVYFRRQLLLLIFAMHMQNSHD